MKKNRLYRKKTSQTDIYQQVTDKIIAALETGVGPWIKPWDDSKVAFGLHRNGSSERSYRGINVLLLNLVAFEKGYADPRWVTFHDVQRLGGRIKKGEKHTKVVFWKILEIEKEDQEKQKVIPLVRVHRVFNVEQCEHLNIQKLSPATDETIATTNQSAESILTLPTIRHGGTKAAFYPAQDFIQIPPKNSFESLEHYYATAFHEVTHWTGHDARLQRTFGKRFGDKDYAFEELVAEIGSAFLGGAIGLPFNEMRHPEYIQEWIKVLKDDKRAVFNACRLSQTATDFIWGELENRELKTA